MKIIKKKMNTGQTIMEYIIISALIGIFCLLSMKSLMTSLQKKITNVKERINKYAPI